MYRLVFDSPAGHLCLESSDGIFLERVSFAGCVAENSSCRLLDDARRQIEEYLHGKRRDFDIPLLMHGTEFQIKVWKALQTIGYGETRSYRDIAEQIGNIKAVRAVGAANHVNPLAIVVPCHRVIGRDGLLTGYAGGLETKRFLLDLERRMARQADKP